MDTTKYHILTSTLVCLLEAGEHHLRAGDVPFVKEHASELLEARSKRKPQTALLLGVCQVHFEMLVTPHNTAVLLR